MDLCKLLGGKRPDAVHDLYFKRFPVQQEKDGRLTGGETKLGLVSDDIIPNKVCLISDLIKTLPYKPFACSAIDALVHVCDAKNA